VTLVAAEMKNDLGATVFI